MRALLRGVRLLPSQCRPQWGPALACRPYAAHPGAPRLLPAQLPPLCTALGPNLLSSRRYATTTAGPLAEAAAAEATACTVEGSPAASPTTTTPAQWARIYLALGKIRLTNLVVFTAFVPYYVCGGPLLSTTLPALFLGTYLQAMAANGFNQIIERRVDALMPRTRNRPLVVKAIGLPHALCAVTVAATAGSLMLLVGTNPLTCVLGVMSLVTYVGAYTPLKRIHWLNTWVGTIPGALPPLMGAAAATGYLGWTAVFCGGVLALWQIPHFLSLSYLCKNEYRAAGFQMLPCIDVQRAADLSFLHAAALTAWCATLPFLVNCEWWFLPEAAVLNAILLYCAREYKAKPGTATARTLFRYSIVYLAVLLGLLMFHRTLPAKKPAAAASSVPPPALAPAPTPAPAAPTPTPGSPGEASE